MFGERPWVSMAEALGWDEVMGLKQTRGAGMVERYGDPAARPATLPAPTLTGHFTRTEVVVRSGTNAIDVAEVAAGEDPGERPIRLTTREALILQGFPPDYPAQGSKTKQFEQIGNAVPPPMAAAIVSALVGAEAMEAAS